MRRTILNTIVMIVVIFGYNIAWGKIIHVPGINQQTIEGALAIANSTPESDEIIIEANAVPYYEYDLVLVSNVIITGATGDPANVIIDAAGDGRVFLSPLGSIIDNLTIRNLTIRNGYLDEGSGAGVCMKHGSNILFDNLVFSNNNAFVGGEGGGLYIYDCELTLENCDFINCSAWNGGGGVYSDESQLTVIGGSYTSNQSLTSG